jgi:ABC-type nitrate/sulfonate/bicarbonate transport system substrate-binding protein
VTDAVDALRAGEFDYMAGAAHALFHHAPDGGGLRLLAALSRHTYWFLVMRSSLDLRRGADLRQLAGLRIGAAPGPDAGLIQMLVDADVDLASVEIGPIPGTAHSGISFGVNAAAALEDGRIDGFWANGMGAEAAVRNGTGTVMIDARRGDGPEESQHYTFAALMCTQRTLEERPEEVDATVTALVAAQRQLRADPAAATSIGKRLYPAMEAGLIETLIARDAPFYEPAIGDNDFAALVRFAHQRGLTTLTPMPAELIPERVRPLWETT